MIYGPISSKPGDAPPSVQATATAERPRALFTVPAPDSVAVASPVPFALPNRPFQTTAPEQPGTLDAGGMKRANPSIIAGRQPVAASVVQLPPRTVSAGNESVPDVRKFDLPLVRNGWAYRLLRGPMRSTMLAPELQSELDDNGKANVMPARGMNPAVQVLSPAPWYETYTRTIGR